MHICSKLHALVDEIKAAGVMPERMNGDDLELLHKIGDRKECIIWVSDHTRLSSLYMNEAGRKYFGLGNRKMEDFNFGAVLELTHPEDLHIVRSALKHFSIHPEKPYSMCLRMKNADDQWKWLFFAQTAMSYSIGGLPEYMISYICDVEDAVGRSSMNGNVKLQVEKKSLYETLTHREQEVLKLVAAEMTSQEIARKLFIETSTVDTHRKNIIRKLKVKSSVGLVQYALFYAGGQTAIRKVH